MRALILHAAGDLRLDDVPDPSPGPGELVLAVGTALTCATDAKMMRAGAHPALGPLPAPLGHEVTGVVAAVGAGVAWPRVGDRVVVANSAPCGACAVCRSGAPNLCPDIVFLTGAFAELLRVPAAIVARNTHPVGADLAPEVAAFAEPLACALHSVRRCGPAGGREVLVLGGGVQGQLLASLLAAGGDRVHLADPHAERRERRSAARCVRGARRAAGRPAAPRRFGRSFTGGAVRTWWWRPSGDPRHGSSPSRSPVPEVRCCYTAAARPVRGAPRDRPDSLFRDHASRFVSSHPGCVSRSARSTRRGEIAVDEFLHPAIGLEDVAATLTAHRVTSIR